MAGKNKKNSKKGIWGMVVLVLLLFGVVFFNQNFNLTGASVMGISSVQVLSGNNELKDQFLFDIVVNGGGESVSGVINPDEVERFGVDKIPKAFTVEFALSDVSCNYRIESTDRSLFKIYQSTAVERGLQNNPPYNDVSLQTTQNWCENGGADNLPKPVIGNAPDGGVCSNMEEIGEWGYWRPEQRNSLLSGGREDNVGSLGDWAVTNIGGIPFYNERQIGTRGFVQYDVIVKVTNSEGEVVETVLNSEEKTALLGQYGRVKLVGDLGAGELCEIPAINYAIIENSDGKKFVEKNWVDDYFTAYRDLVGFDNDYYEFQWRRQNIDPGVGADRIFGSISSMNNALNQLSLQNVSTGCVIEGSTTKCEPEGDLVYPEIQLLMDADYIGVSKDLQAERDRILQEIQNLSEQNAEANQDRISALQNQLKNLESDVSPVINLPTDGVPEIGDIETASVQANDVGNVVVEVRNVGSEADSFDVDLSCDTDISFGSKRVSLESDEEKEVDIRFNGDAGDYNCEVTATSVNNPSNSDFKSLSVTIDEIPTPEVPEELEGGEGSGLSDSGSTFIAIGLIVVVIGGVAYYIGVRRRKSSKKKK